MGIKTLQNFTLISKLLRKMLKIHKQKSYRQEKGEKLGIFLFYTTNLQKFLANNFFWVLSIISTNLKKKKHCQMANTVDVHGYWATEYTKPHGCCNFG